ncbi:hypothetical protein BJY24_007342 [Nocardia transvalensis]|uniref:Uncharacterized protein n=1 Tax=Nocardia transvalensis TaxID=37333 RepID=A0A7W9PM26_9NOCA|nr:hypothetical protein [Nocardia transvalensis]MBB5918430.1 hypothetical protein [Nocardia transvalensis]
MPPRKADVDIRETPEFRQYQDNERFQAWLRMHDAAMEIDTPLFDMTGMNELYSREGLVRAERELVKKFADSGGAFTTDNYKLGMRFVYYIGETFRRAIEGRWVALPPDPPQSPQPKSVIDVEYRSKFYNPQHMIGLALGRRTGTEITSIFDRAVKAHQKWVDAGRPARGTWEGYA